MKPDRAIALARHILRSVGRYDDDAQAVRVIGATVWLFDTDGAPRLRLRQRSDDAVEVARVLVDAQAALVPGRVVVGAAGAWLLGYDDDPARWWCEPTSPTTTGS